MSYGHSRATLSPHIGHWLLDTTKIDRFSGYSPKNPWASISWVALEGNPESMGPGQKSHIKSGQKIGYTSRFVRVILAQGPC